MCGATEAHRFADGGAPAVSFHVGHCGVVVCNGGGVGGVGGGVVVLPLRRVGVT